MDNQKTIQQVAKDDDVAPAQVGARKKELETRIGEIFERKNAANEAAERLGRKSARLERKIGQLVIEKEFLLEKCEALGIDTSEKTVLIREWMDFYNHRRRHTAHGGRT